MTIEENIRARLVFFGDSICVGQLVSVHETWVSQIARDAGKAIGHENLLVSNVSVSGNTTRMALERMKFDVHAGTRVDVLYTQFGLNDANHWADEYGIARVPIKAYRENMREIIQRGFAYGAQTVLVGTNHPVPAKNNWIKGIAAYPEQVSAYNAIVREVARDEGAILVDHAAYWDAQRVGRASLLQDGVHLGPVGHDAYYALASGPIVEQIVSYAESEPRVTGVPPKSVQAVQ